MKVKQVRVLEAPAPQDVGLSVLRKFAEYQAGKEVIGTTFLEAPLLGRRAQLCSLDNGEHLLLLMQDHRFYYWEASRAPFDLLHRRVCDWLTEPRSAETLTRAREARSVRPFDE